MEKQWLGKQFNSDFWHNHFKNNKGVGKSACTFKIHCKDTYTRSGLSRIWDKQGQQGIKAFISILLRLLRQIITRIQCLEENYLSQSSVHINLNAPGHSFREINRPLYRRLMGQLVRFRYP